MEMLIPAAGTFSKAVQKLKTFNATLKCLPVWGKAGRSWRGVGDVGLCPWRVSGQHLYIDVHINTSIHMHV